MSHTLLRALALLATAAGAAVATPAGRTFACAPSNDPVVCSALGDLYYATNGAQWTDNTGWADAAAGTPVDYCAGWEGDYGGPALSTFCDDDGVLYWLNLNTNNLVGTLPDSLGNLTGLLYFDFDTNFLTGTIPASLSSLTNLLVFIVHDNALTGTVPDVSQMSNLLIFSVDANQLEGPLYSLEGLSAVTYLNAWGNKFSGSIPDLSSMTGLNFLGLETNELTGTVPSWVGSLTNLEYLFLDTNLLEGTIPNLSNLTVLEELWLYNNNFTGSLPQLGNMTALTQLMMSNNMFSGSIPDSWASLTALEKLLLNGNALSGNIPSWLANLTAVTNLQLGSNLFSGSIPEELGSLTRLQQLALSNLNLSGTLPSSIGQLTSLTNLAINNCALTGALPPSLGNLSHIQFLDLSSNGFNSSIPDAMAGLITSEISYLRLDDNDLSGELPGWLSTFPGGYLGLRGNAFSGGLPSGMLSYPFNSEYALCSQFCQLAADPTQPQTCFWTLPEAPTSPAHACTFYNATDGNTYAPTLPAVYSVPGAFITACPAGTYSAGAVTSGGLGSLFFPVPRCAPCAPGTVAPQPDASFCTPCPAGTYGAGDGINCISCGANAISPVSSASAAACSCAVGYERVGAACASCVAGTFFNFTSARCQTCAPGYYSAAGAAACSPCPPSTYSTSATTCGPCPAGSSSPAGTGSLLECRCAFGFFQDLDDSGVFTACKPCLPGSLCTGDGTPLATEGFWHPPGDSTAFFDCEAGFCLAETAAPALNATARRMVLQQPSASAAASNCRVGHTGPLCSLCVEGWTIQGQFCAECPANADFRQWPRAKLGGVVFISVLIFLVGTVGFMLSPVIQPKERLSRMSSRLSVALAASASKRLSRSMSMGVPKRAVTATKVLTFMLVPIRLVIENLQIVSSFSRTMRLPWPAVHTHIMARLSFVNLNLLTLPSTACQTQNVDFYDGFNGITVGVGGFLVYMVLLWAIGRAFMRARSYTAEAVAAFDRATTSRFVAFLLLAYAPVTEKVLAVFSCRPIGDTYVLRHAPSTLCYDARHTRYRRLGGFWIVFYVIGVPLYCLGLMLYYRIPWVVADLRREARLRALLDFARRRHVAQYLEDDRALSTATISEAHVNLLHACFLVKKHGDATATAALTHAQKLQQLLQYSREHLAAQKVTWRDAAGDPRMAGAQDAIGDLFGELKPAKWYWILVEVFNKLLITGILGFIAPGTAAQVSAGVGLTFLMFLAYQNALPYSEKAYRQIGYAAAIELFLFLVFGQMLKADVQVTSNNSQFYGAALGVLTCAIFVLPVLIVARRLRWFLNRQAEEEEEAAAAEASTKGADAEAAHSDDVDDDTAAERAAAPVGVA